MRQPGGPGAVAGDPHQALVEHHHLPVVLDGEHRVGQPLVVAHQTPKHLGHLRAPLHRRRGRGVGGRRRDAGEQLAHGGQQHAGLAERGQHFADVAEEGRVRADDQHGAPRQQFAVFVEQEGGAVEGDRGLAGARPALDHHHPLVRGADDAVLVGLDGPHDVAHPAGAGLVERGQQHGVAGGVLVAGAGGVAEVEDLVVQRGDRAALAGDVPAAAQPHRGVAGGQVERPRHLGAPVDQQRGAFLVAGPDADPADVVGGAAGEVDPAEAQRAVDRVQGGEQPGPLGDQDVALQPPLPRGALLGERLLDGTVSVRAQGLDVRMESVDEFLLAPQFEVVEFVVPAVV